MSGSHAPLIPPIVPRVWSLARAVLLVFALLTPWPARSESGEPSGAIEPQESSAPQDSSASKPRESGEPQALSLRFVAEIGRSGNGPGEFRRPLVLAPAPAGGFLVTDAGNSRVQYLDEAARFRWEAGGAGTDEGTLERPVAITASGLEVLVLDTGRKQVLQFHARGEYLGVVLALSAPDVERRVGEVDPRGIALDRSGNLLVTDREGDRLLVFAANGDLLYSAGGFGDGAQQFEDPEGVVTSSTRIFVADSGNRRVQVLDPQGRFQASWPLPGGGRPAGLASDDEGRLYVTDADRGRILVFDPKGRVIAEAGAEGAGPAELHGPAGVCALEKGQVIVADSENDRLVQFALTAGGIEP